MDVFVGVSGASGAPYARRLLQLLVQGGSTVGVCVSAAGSSVIGQELYDDLRMPRAEVIERFGAECGVGMECFWSPDDYGSPYASGSALWDAAVVIPCSMSTVATIASGAEGNLIHRAANVAIKERRQLIVVPRETPMSVIHLDNLSRIAHAGVSVVPAMPAFYQHPQTVDDMVDFVVARVLNLLGVRQDLLAPWRGD